MTGSSLGLALGGGAALGAAHVGVLQAFDEAGVNFPIIVGTSAGALIGGAYAAGMSGDQLAELILDARFSTFASPRTRRGLGVFDTEVMERNIEAAVGPLHIEDLPRRFAAVAFDLRARRAVLVTSGPLTTALRASSAVPGLFPPVRVGDQLLVDGMLAENVPVAAARRLGADRVVAVNVDPASPDRFVASLGRRTRDSLGHGFGPDHGPTLILRPQTAAFSRWSHTDVPALIASGRQAVEDAWSPLREFMTADAATDESSRSGS